MTSEQMASHLRGINDLLISLVADAAQLGLDQVVQDLNAARTFVVTAGLRLEPPPDLKKCPMRRRPFQRVGPPPSI